MSATSGNEPDWDDLADEVARRLETELCPSSHLGIKAPRYRKDCGSCMRELIGRVLEMVGRIRDDETGR